MKKRHIARITTFTKIEQFARVSVVKIFTHLVGIGVGRQAIEGESQSAGLVERIEYTFKVSGPL
ncbi:hypothetical protein D3C84_1105540 [compost metagenome]